MEEDSCAFCGAAGDEAAVRTQERLGVRVAVCAACRERFAGTRPALPPPRRPAQRSPELPPTLGQQSSAVFAMVQRMARIAADRPYVEEDCSHCGHRVHRYPGLEGRPVRLAKESVLAASVPAVDRWRVVEGRAVPVEGGNGAADGAADEVAADEGTADEDTAEDQVGARVLHDVVCPANPVPDNPRLARMWHAHLAPPAAD